MNKKIIKNKNGFFELKEKLSHDHLNNFYSGKYYQNENNPSYKKKYSSSELKYINNRIEHKYNMISKILKPAGKDTCRLLDIGCGEGWMLQYFLHRSWDVLGLDYSEYGCSNHNPSCLGYLRTGDIFSTISSLISESQKFDVICLDNVLEHVLDPLLLLKKCKKLIKKHGIIIIEVPNDFSDIQQYLLENHYVSEPYWVSAPDHISYFNRQSLIAICERAGLKCLDLLSDFPIELNLFNNNTNYVHNKKVGKSCHNARIDIENFFYSHSEREKINQLYRIFAELGIGRLLVGYFKLYD